MITIYQIRRLGHLLKTRDAWIEGKVSGGTRWPEYPHYWIVADSTTQTIHHVPVDERPTWAKYDIYTKEGG